MFIKNGLNSDKPVAMLVAFNSSLPFEQHWVTILQGVEDNIKKTNEIEVSSWGERMYVNLSDYVNDEKLYFALAYLD